MTYNNLMEYIHDKMTVEQRNMDVTVSCDLSEEAIPVKTVFIIKDATDLMSDVLDIGHPVLTIDF